MLRAIGRTFIALGLLIFLFLIYQLFGTNLVTNHDQKQLFNGLKRAWAEPAQTHVEIGDGVALIQIPKIGVERVVVEGIGIEDLKRGPGHYPGTSFPGEKGNVVISGHRTTYGAPFYRLDELQPGDEIRLTDRLDRLSVYKVTEQKIVRPTDLTVVVPSDDARLTLTTCNPRFSAKQRLIIVASLVGSAREKAAA